MHRDDTLEVEREKQQLLATVQTVLSLEKPTEHLHLLGHQNGDLERELISTSATPNSKRAGEMMNTASTLGARANACLNMTPNDTRRDMTSQEACILSIGMQSTCLIIKDQ